MADHESSENLEAEQRINPDLILAEGQVEIANLSKGMSRLLERAVPIDGSSAPVDLPEIVAKDIEQAEIVFSLLRRATGYDYLAAKEVTSTIETDLILDIVCRRAVLAGHASYLTIMLEAVDDQCRDVRRNYLQLWWDPTKSQERAEVESAIRDRYASARDVARQSGQEELATAAERRLQNLQGRYN